MTGAEIESLLVISKSQEAQKLIIVIERFSDPHDHHAVDPLSGRSSGQEHLSEHLATGKRPSESGMRRGTETASHLAPGLRGDTDRKSGLITHQHRFDTVSVIEAEHELLRTVEFRDQVFLDTHALADKIFQKARLDLLTEIRHLLGIDHAFTEPRIDLGRTKSGISLFSDIFFPHRKIHIQNKTPIHDQCLLSFAIKNPSIPSSSGRIVIFPRPLSSFSRGLRSRLSGRSDEKDTHSNSG